MNGYVDPSVVLLPSPVGIDAAIQSAQMQLSSGLPWLQKSFGRAILQNELPPAAEATKRVFDTRKREILYPETYGPKQEPLNMMPNDNLKSYSFWVVRDPSETVDYEPLANQQFMRTTVSVIFWFNLYKIDPTKDFRFNEQLKRDVLKVLQTKVPRISVTTVFEQYNKVFEPFTITETHRQYLKPPFGAFRIDCDLSYPMFPDCC